MKNRRRNWQTLGVAGAAFVVLAAVVIKALAGRAEGRRPVAGSQLRVIFTGETSGELEPCDCSGPESGGLPRRGGYLEAQKGEYLVLDIGCMGSGAREFELLRLDAVLRGMAAMKYDAANVAEPELWLGKTELSKRREHPVTLVSANVVDESGRNVVRPYILLERSGLKAAVSGVVSAGRYLTGPGLKVDDPFEALGKILPAMVEQSGIIIVLADLDASEVRQLVNLYPEISLVLYRARGDSHLPETLHRTVIAAVAGEALYVGDITLSWDARGQVEGHGAFITLEAQFPQSQRVLSASIDGYKQAIRGRRFDLAQPGPGWSRLATDREREGDRYAGSSTCKSCHTPAHEIWESSAHAHAMETLARVGYDYSPECVVCHVVAYGAGDGYHAPDDTPDLAGVGCEACHGRGGQHVSSKGQDQSSLVRGDESVCLRCHTPRRSHNFSFVEAYVKIRH